MSLSSRILHTLPSRGKWISARAKYYRANGGMSAIKAIEGAAADWDQGRPVYDWDYRKYAK